MESLVKLTVKTPNQGIDDIQVDCELNWTVRKLKEYLQDVYPSKPSSSSQKLIYLGRLLQDHLSLKEVFGVSSYIIGDWGARTVHIVCSDLTEMATTTASLTTATSTTNSVSTANTPATDGLRFRGHTSPQGLPSSQPFMGTTTTMMSSMFPQYATSVGNTTASSSQYYQMQTQYAQQYQQQMQLYYQQWYQWQQTMGGGQTGQMPYNQFIPGILPTPPNTPLSSSPVTCVSPQPFPEQVQPPTPETQPQPQPQPQPQQVPPQPQPEVLPNPPNQNNLRMNAGPGGVGMQDDEDDNDNPRNRDWLDWLYTSLRAIMLLSIVYFYSSTSRFIMVTILAFLLYLYQNGWFTPRRVPGPPVDEPQVNAQNEDQGEVNEQQNNLEQQDDNNDINMATQQPLPNEPPRPSPLRMLCTFFVSFVTSLIPNPPAIPQQ